MSNEPAQPNISHIKTSLTVPTGDYISKSTTIMGKSREPVSVSPIIPTEWEQINIEAKQFFDLIEQHTNHPKWDKKHNRALKRTWKAMLDIVCDLWGVERKLIPRVPHPN